MSALRALACLAVVAVTMLFGAAQAARAAEGEGGGEGGGGGEGEITLQGRYWIDETGRASIEQASGGGVKLESMDRHRAFALGNGALWMRFDLGAHDPAQRWYLMLTGAAFINRASLFTRAADGRWQEQRAGDHVAVAQWDHPNFTPLFLAPPQGGTVWLRLENRPAPTSPFVQLLSDDGLQKTRQWTDLLVGGYLGFGLLVFIVGLMHGRLYREAVFDVYCIYVACMLLFQLSFTGLGGVFLWPQWWWFNDAAPALFMLVMVGSGIWFIRESTALQRHSRKLDRAVVAFFSFGFVFPVFYVLFNGPLVYAILNVYGLLSVILSISLCLWTWRRGERYSFWLFLGFLPVHLAYPFPALRAAGVLPDSWATQYAVLIGSAIEIPLLLWILHARAKDFSENRARMRALDSTDPLTGLTATPVLMLRLRDALRRARRADHRCSLLLVELANHAEIVSKEGREAGDRSLVVAASRLSSVVREVDTVCRIANARFAILVEGPQPQASRRALAQHIVARGLERVAQLPPDLALRFRAVSAWVPDASAEAAPSSGVGEQVLMQMLNFALDRLLEEPKRVVHHLEPRPDAVSQPAAATA
ncbi:MAG TPA: 7TM diverse intracellular signaling domain-containing protein [Ramlibacter sp.]|uniref:sensor domain-containing diguanylate cyclase n=1 Tax=Ramlibacter sp. TaxID=1917967 RepID=UPI002BA098CE|nr:7TM diverse intracellular signaling domain-containing protein [Ramlibacter sp.]HVZ42166.1 7TM diverse intracellular signaling domain-containing protein [Ramlibacter sp.]